MSELECSDIEEANAKCNMCSAGLSIIENMLYGNRCIFCSSQDLPIKNIGLPQYLARCYIDWQIYQRIVRVWKKKGKEEARMFLLGCIGVLGFIDINQVQTVKQKKALLRILK